MTCFACGIAKTPNAQIGDVLIFMICINNPVRVQTLSGMVRRSPAAACVQIRLNIKKTGALLYAVGCSTYSVAQVNESAAYLFFANLRYLTNFSPQTVCFFCVLGYIVQKKTHKRTL